METMIKKFCKKYKLPEQSLSELLSHMTEISFPKGEVVIQEGERNSNFYLIKKGIWRAYYLADGTEISLWFVGPGEAAFSSWGYVDGKASRVSIEAVNDSVAYCIGKAELEELFARSIAMANFGRKIFEREILSVDYSALAYGAPPTAKERYLALMERNPELLQDVPLKYLASYLYITPQSLSRIRAGLRKK
ncbi:MAG: Crp/Fnr family transcriptional regulator [Bacteroides sp.]|nr:Crp/Fnr family transcriptional regulator [Bacteroides sp.]